MDSVGELLRRERLRQGLELAHVAAQTRINLSYLEAIEDGNIAGLPGGFFYRAFVRQYARLLGLDEEHLEPALSAMRAQEEAAQPLPDFHPPPAAAVPPMPVPGSRRAAGPKWSSVILLVAVIIGCSGIYALWQRWRRAVPAAPPPVRVEQPAPAPVAPPPPVVETPPAEPAKPAETAPAQPPPAAAPAPEPSAATDARLVIEVVASDAVWMSATMDGKKTVAVLKDGQTRRFTANERASLFTGNAGGMEVRVNGKPIGPLGPRGHLRTVVITPEGFSITNPREQKEPPEEP